MIVSRRRAAAVAGLVAVAVLAACSTSVAGTGTRTGAAPSAASSSPDFPSSGVPSGTGAPTTDTPTTDTPTMGAPTSGVGVEVGYRTPAGFTEVQGYAPAIPLETDYKSVYMIAAQNPGGLDLLSIIIYVLPPGTDVASATAQKQRIASYVAKLKATVLAGPLAATVAGQASFSLAATQPGATGSVDGKFHYDTSFTFLPAQARLIEVACQYDKLKTVVETACPQLTGSITITPG